ncbi:anti-sigma factor [Nakamurella deserti]|uniref:anti-sigma factor n=1 Tax=Nakamurella deserti TaxID=2164074 RepID=UPI000DBE3BD0|nr:zf-HC2 domain-containing protein [Nakamurella deserti]
MNAEEHRALRELVGAYVLGGLSGAERTSVQAHLDGCAACRAEVAELAPVAAALRGVDPDAVAVGTPPPPELGDAILTSVREGARRRDRDRLLRRAGAGLLAAAVLAGVFLLGVQLAPAPSAPPVIAMAVDRVAAGVRAEAGLVRHTWGTELKLTATGLAEGSYTVAFVRSDGSVVPGGTFIGTGANTLNCSLNGALPLEETVEITVTDAGGAVVVDAHAV